MAAPSAVNQCPPELLSLVFAHVYFAGLAPCPSSLDPLITVDDAVPTALPSSYPAAHWPESTARKILATACLVSRAWYDASKPWLWHRVEVRLPRSWMALVEELAGGDDDEVLDEEDAALLVDQTIQDAETVAWAAQSLAGGQSASPDMMRELHGRLLASLSYPDSSIPPDLLSPPATRDPSPRRIRAKSKSPARWKLMRTISNAMQNVMEQHSPGVYVPAPHDPHPGRFVRHLDFNHFRTIGMRRSLEEGVTGRFVTGGRLLALLKELPYLLAFGATEYMDGALTFDVLQELLLRGAPSCGRGRPIRGREPTVVDHSDPQEEDRERRREYRDLQALDLTGCVSDVFNKAVAEFVAAHLAPAVDDEVSDIEDDTPPRGARRVRFRMDKVDEPLTFPSLRRLCLRGAKLVQSQPLQLFVLAFPSLTHLDLSCTRITGDFLDALGKSRTVRLQSLALERCNWLTGESIRNLLVDSPVTQDLKELSLYGDWTFPSPLSEEDMLAIFSRAPCFRSGQLVYLDLSSTPLTAPMLLDVCASLPHLRSLGLSYIRQLPLAAVASFLKEKAPKVEILTLVCTSPDLGYGEQFVRPRQATIALHTQIIHPLCTAPFSFSLSSPASAAKAPPPTYLRVVELASAFLTNLGGGADTWRIVRSKGGRGWYVDSASGWIAGPGANASGDASILRRDLDRDHPWRVQIERLAGANGNVTSDVGWHARKMEVLHGDGLLGREAGLYGAVSFAYQG